MDSQLQHLVYVFKRIKDGSVERIWCIEATTTSSYCTSCVFLANAFHSDPAILLGPISDMQQDSIIEVPRPELSERHSQILTPALEALELKNLVEEYFVATTGLVDLFERGELTSTLQSWINGASNNSEVVQATHFLVLAIGIQEQDDARAETWFKRARDDLLINLCGSMNVATVQGFALVALYMLRAFQPNGAYLYFCEPMFRTCVVCSC